MSKPQLLTVWMSEVPTVEGPELVRLHRVVKWAELVRLEPRVKALRARARRFHRYRGGFFCANAVWYGERSGYDGYPGLCTELETIVGWYADTPNRIARSAEAFDEAVHVIYEALPDCQDHCVCQCGPDLPLEFFEDGPERVRQDWNRMQRHVGPLIFDRDGGCCVQCGSSEYLSVDHIIPITAGGQNSLSNFQTLCRSCNSRKGVKVQHDS